MFFEENTLRCRICNARVEPHLLACRFCFGAEDVSLKRPKRDKVSPNDGELIKGVPSLSFSRAIERAK